MGLSTRSVRTPTSGGGQSFRFELSDWQTSDGNQVRREVDDRHTRGDFILTGSARPRDDVARHSGAGRIGVLRMRPMSVFESGHSTGEVSFAALLRFASTVDPSRHGPPSALGVITSTGAAGRRADGVHVIPIGCLGP